MNTMWEIRVREIAPCAVCMMLLCCAIVLCGCEGDLAALDERVDSLASSEEINQVAATGSADALPVPLSSVVWLSGDVSAWPKTATLSPVTFGGGLINLRYDKTNVWPNNGAGLNANSWIFIERNGTWYAATHEYMRRGYTTRGMNTINTAHLKHSALDGWVVQSGVRYGWMVSGLSRGGNRNVQERSNIVMATWP
jgi:hypothetical protein